MNTDPNIIALRKYIYEAIQNSTNPKMFNAFWNCISFPPESNGRIIFNQDDEAIIAVYHRFIAIVKEAESHFHEERQYK